MNFEKYGSFILEETAALLAIDSPSGMTQAAADHVIARFEALGYRCERTRKDGVLVYFGGEETDNGELMYLIKETPTGSIISFTSTEPSKDYVGNTVFLFFCLCLGSIAIFFVISERLAHCAVMPVKKAWENQKRFVADASHDLKTPLTVILANNDILKSHGEESVNSQQKWIESTGEEALKMKGLVTQMLDLAKSENALCLTTSRVNLSELTEKEILHQEPIAFEKQGLHYSHKCFLIGVYRHSLGNC